MNELPELGVRAHGNLDPRSCIAVAEAAEARLAFRPRCPQTPIYMAAMGDRSLALCGQIGDGLIVSNLCPPGYTARAVGIVEHAAAQASRPSPRVVQYVPCVARPDRHS